MLNANELKQKTKVELQKMAAELRADIRELRFKINTRQQTKVRTLRVAKRDLARILTVLQSLV